MAKKKRFGHKKRPTKSTPKKSVKTSKQVLKLVTEDSEVSTGRGSSENSNPKPVLKVRGRGDSGMILTDPHRLRSDLKLTEIAVRKGWNVRRKQMLRRRLEEIAMKTEASVVTRDGVIELESAADKLAIDAVKVLVAMDNADVARIIKKPEVPAVQVNVNNSTTNVNLDRRTTELARLAYALGAKELVVEGRSIPIAEALGTDPSVQSETSEADPAT